MFLLTETGRITQIVAQKLVAQLFRMGGAVWVLCYLMEILFPTFQYFLHLASYRVISSTNQVLLQVEFD